MRSLVDKIRDDIRYKLRIQSFDQIELGSKTLDRPWDDILIQLGNQLRIEFGNQLSNQLFRPGNL